MKTIFSEFNPTTYSFKTDPVLVLENFWTKEERASFRKANLNGPPWLRCPLSPRPLKIVETG